MKKSGRVAEVTAARYQAPDHHVLEYAGARQNDHPTLVDATLKTCFSIAAAPRWGSRWCRRSSTSNRPLASRCMDGAPWVYRRMADELQEEGKTAVYGDVREYLYVDAKLTLSDAAVAAVARGADGTWRSSDRGIKELAVDRNGWVRNRDSAIAPRHRDRLRLLSAEVHPGKCRDRDRPRACRSMTLQTRSR